MGKKEEKARIARLITTKFNNDYSIDNKDKEAIEHILSAYKEVLKENESLQKTYDDCYCEYKHYMQFESISKQRIEDIIDRIDYDIKKTKEIISNDLNIYTSDRRNDYQIVRLKAMNTKSLDIKKRLQELLESEE